MIKQVKLLLLFSVLIFAEERLFTHPYWHKLLHFKNGESQIDDKSFFLSKNGKTSPKKELEATLEALKSSNPNDVNGTQCRYPARTRWLRENLPNRNIKECTHLPAHLKKFDFKTLYLVYTSSFMNAPASMVGHTFLRFDKDEKTPLLSYALNYSAQIDDNPNIISYAYKGLFGGFKGRYSIVPYYEMVKLYSDMEHRDMWEYKLDLTPQEIEQVVLHMFEIKTIYSDYFFASENCSYNLLWFIELAKEELKLVDKFDHITAPMDTIKELEHQNLIKTSIFRASKTTKIKDIYKRIKAKKVAKNFLKTSNIDDINTLPISQQIDILSLYFLKNDNKNLTKLLLYRSKLDRSRLDIKKSEQPTPTTDPIKSNRSTKATLSYQHQAPEFGLRFAYHDIHDVDYDFNEGSYISFFDIRVTPHQLNALKLIDINAISKPHPLYNPYSWGLSLGWEREDDNNLITNLKLKGGKSFDLFSALLFLQPNIEISYDQKAQLSLGYEMGLLKSFRNFKMGLLISQYQKEGFFTYQFLDDMALHLSLIEKEGESVGGVGVFFYF